MTEYEAAHAEYMRLMTARLRHESSPAPIEQVGQHWLVKDPSTGKPFATYRTKREALSRASRWGSEVGRQDIEAARERLLRAAPVQ